jgi:hypothetical protein
MNYTLHKLYIGFIITSDEKIKEGDLVLNSLNCIQSFLKDYNDINAEKVIAQKPNIIFSDLTEDEQKRIGWFDVEKLALEEIPFNNMFGTPSWMDNNFKYRKEWEKGFRKAQKLLADRKFTEEQVRKSLLEVALWGKVSTTRFEDVEKIIQSLSQPKYWPVELEMKDYVEEETGSEFKWMNKRPKLTDGKVKILKLL